MPFQIHALPIEPFEEYFDMAPKMLAAQNAHLETVTQNPGTPCRVSMQDANIGETVLLINYDHSPQNSPYKASHAIFVRKNAQHKQLKPNEVPAVLANRLLSVRAFDSDHFMRDADVVDGTELAKALENIFKNQYIKYVHIHNAKPGCFAAKATRV